MDFAGRATYFVKKFAPSLLDRAFRWVVGTEKEKK
jgi:hypothetical protein